MEEDIRERTEKIYYSPFKYLGRYKIGIEFKDEREALDVLGDIDNSALGRDSYNILGNGRYMVFKDMYTFRSIQLKSPWGEMKDNSLAWCVWTNDDAIEPLGRIWFYFTPARSEYPDSVEIVFTTEPTDSNEKVSTYLRVRRLRKSWKLLMTDKVGILNNSIGWSGFETLSFWPSDEKFLDRIMGNNLRRWKTGGFLELDKSDQYQCVHIRVILELYRLGFLDLQETTEFMDILKKLWTAEN
jgi:hypothetical protein